ncbi:MAG TPA: hypothetical protein VMJ64_09095 [Anaerolineales bacterium]|nr:hypothetical protein [Anaerolineales bacterium]
MSKPIGNRKSEIVNPMSKTTRNSKAKTAITPAPSAARHGFYGELFTPEEHALLDLPLALEDEQMLLRVRLRRLARRMTAELDLKDELSSITALARLMQMIATLERVRLLLQAHGNADGEVLAALAELDPYEEL